MSSTSATEIKFFKIIRLFFLVTGRGILWFIVATVYPAEAGLRSSASLCCRFFRVLFSPFTSMKTGLYKIYKEVIYQFKSFLEFQSLSATILTGLLSLCFLLCSLSPLPALPKIHRPVPASAPVKAANGSHLVLLPR